MTTDPPPRSPPLVWVTVGKTQHPAFLLDSGKQGNLVRWVTTAKTEWVDSDDIELELSPRRRRTQQSQSADVTVSSKSPSPGKRRRQDVGKEKKKSKPSPDPKVAADLKTAPHSLAGSTESLEDEDDESDIEILFTIQPPTPNRPRSAEKKPSPVRPKPPEERPASVVTASSSDGGVQSSISSSENLDSNGVLTDGEQRCISVEQEATTTSFSNDDSIHKRGDVAAALDTGPTQYTKPPEERPASVVTASSSDDGVQSSISSSENLDSNGILPDGEQRCSPIEQEATTASFSNNDSLHARGERSIPVEQVATTTSGDVAIALEEDTGPIQYTLTSSAYMQNLAEICYTITQDRRWRVGPSLQPLFQWESGQDLSAVALLSRRFQPAPRHEKKAFPCTCLLCRDKKLVGLERGKDVDVETPVSPEEPPSNNDSDEEEERCIYLYCRLFYRKGPWFRLDDIYSKYYAPKDKGASFQQLEEEQNPQATKEPPNASKENFFRPHLAGNQAKRKSLDSMIDQELLEQHIDRMSQLLSDMVRLRSTGLIRSFSGEEECGKTVGVTLLTAEERASVLSKLGGDKRIRGTNENEIWKQMSRQRSIFAKSASGSGTEQSVLPVLKHVDEALLDRLSRTIVQACSRTEYIPAPIIRVQSELVKDAFKASILKLPTDLKPYMCFRLREAPLLTLQRCARLYLCATSGPGEMRSNGSNGWKSLQNVEANPPLARMIPPPGLQSWSQISYPSLMHRFGVKSSYFIDAYDRLPVQEPEESTSRLISNQVFLSMVRSWCMSTMNMFAFVLKDSFTPSLDHFHLPVLFQSLGAVR
jgi:hypothetical protein